MNRLQTYQWWIRCSLCLKRLVYYAEKNSMSTISVKQIAELDSFMTPSRGFLKDIRHDMPSANEVNANGNFIFKGNVDTPALTLGALRWGGEERHTVTPFEFTLQKENPPPPNPHPLMCSHPMCWWKECWDECPANRPKNSGVSNSNKRGQRRTRKRTKTIQSTAVHPPPLSCHFWSWQTAPWNNNRQSLTATLMKDLQIRDVDNLRLRHRNYFAY